MPTNEELFEQGKIDELWTKNQKFIKYLYKKYNGLQPEYDEFIGMAGEAFALATRCYDASKGKFVNVWSKIFLYRLLHNCRELKRHQADAGNSVSLDYTVTYNTSTGEPKPLADLLQDDTDVQNEAITKSIYDEWLQDLPDLHREIIDLRSQGLSQSQIGHEVGTNQAKVSRVLIRAKKDLIDKLRG